MLIPKHHRQLLRKIGLPHWFWFSISDWAFGERYKFRDGSIAYLYEGKIITIRQGSRRLWGNTNENTRL